MKNMYYALALISFACIGADCDSFIVWLAWEVVWIATLLISISQIDRLEEKK